MTTDTNLLYGYAPGYMSIGYTDAPSYGYNLAAAMNGLPNFAQVGSGTAGSADWNDNPIVIRPDNEGTYVQGICPDGWHLPSYYDDWNTLRNTLSNNQMYCGNNTGNIAKALADNNASSWETHINECAVGNNIAANNASGFSAIGIGYVDILGNGTNPWLYMLRGYYTTFWSSDLNYYIAPNQQMPSGVYGAYVVGFGYNDSSIDETNNVKSKEFLLPIRCVRNEAEGTLGQMQQTIDEQQQQIQQLQQQLNQQQGSAPTATVSFVSMDYNKATVQVTVNGQGEYLLAKGVCWVDGTYTPTLNDNYVTKDTNVNTFNITIPNLSMGYTYTVRAFATTANGTGYSTVVTFKMEQTVPVTGSRTINLGVDSIWIYDAGGPNYYYPGYCDGYLVINPNSSTKKVKLLAGTYNTESCCDYIEIYDGTSTTATTQYKGSGSVTAYTSTSADGALTVRFRSDYSVQNAGFALKFVLEDAGPCGRATTVSDYDGNSYSIKAFGSQCWMTQNLRTTRYSNGTSITLASYDTSSTTAYRYYPANSSNNVSSYGYLYNWKAVMRTSSSSSTNPSGVQGICPTGWHVPSDAEFTQLTDYLTNQGIYKCSNNSSNIAKAMASTTGWRSSTNTCAVGNTPSTNNTSGFSAMPAGLYDGLVDNLFGDRATFWTATQNGSLNAYYHYLYYQYAYVGRYSNRKYVAYSVRCVKN